MSGASVAEIEESWREPLKEFAEKRKPFLLYE